MLGSNGENCWSRYAFCRHVSDRRKQVNGISGHQNHAIATHALVEHYGACGPRRTRLSALVLGGPPLHVCRCTDVRRGGSCPAERCASQGRQRSLPLHQLSLYQTSAAQLEAEVLQVLYGW